MSGITLMLQLCLEWHYKIIIGWYQRGLVIIPTVMTATEPNLGHKQALDWNNLQQFILLKHKACKIGLYSPQERFSFLCLLKNSVNLLR